jgi:hypothetical protein
LLGQLGGLAIDEPYRTYRLIETRQVRTGTINYFDHRRFGVIARVDKWEPPVVELPVEEPLGEDPAMPVDESPDS